MRGALRRCRPRGGPVWIATIHRDTLGRLQVVLPAGLPGWHCAPGTRVWFAARLGQVEVTVRPRGRRPPQGRRCCRMKRARGRPDGSRYTRPA